MDRQLRHSTIVTYRGSPPRTSPSIIPASGGGCGVSLRVTEVPLSSSLDRVPGPVEWPEIGHHGEVRPEDAPFSVRVKQVYSGHMVYTSFRTHG